MARPHGTDAAGNALNLVGGVMSDTPASVPGIVVNTPEEPMAKAPHDGIYTLHGGRFWIRCGDELPAAAVMDDVEERAEPKAPENKAKPAAPENRAAKKAS